MFTKQHMGWAHAMPHNMLTARTAFMSGPSTRERSMENDSLKPRRASNVMDMVEFRKIGYPLMRCAPKNIKK